MISRCMVIHHPRERIGDAERVRSGGRRSELARLVAEHHGVSPAAADLQVRRFLQVRRRLEFRCPETKSAVRGLECNTRSERQDIPVLVERANPLAIQSCVRARIREAVVAEFEVPESLAIECHAEPQGRVSVPTGQVDARCRIREGWRTGRSRSAGKLQSRIRFGVREPVIAVLAEAVYAAVEGNTVGMSGDGCVFHWGLSFDVYCETGMPAIGRPCAGALPKPAFAVEITARVERKMHVK